MMDESRQRLHDEMRDDLFKRQLSNSQFLDKAILSLSGAGLAFSFVFIKDMVPSKPATNLFLLYISWVSFILPIVCTLFSFLIGQMAIKKQLKLNYDYYILEKEEVKNLKNQLSPIIPRLSWASVILYIIAVISIATFVKLNIKQIITQGGVSL